MATITSALTFKKLAAGAAVLGLVAVPSLVTAQGAVRADTQTSANVAAAANSPVADAAVNAHATNTLSSDVKSDASGPATGTGSVTTGTTVPTTTNTNLNTSVSFKVAVDTTQSLFTSKAAIQATLLESKTSTPTYLVTFSDGSQVVIDGTSGKLVFSYDAAAKTTTGTWTLPLTEPGVNVDTHTGVSTVQRLSAGL